MYDYGFRIYDPRIAKFLSVDPLSSSYPWYTPYQFAGNKPVWAIDIDGLEPLVASDYASMAELRKDLIVVNYLDEETRIIAVSNMCNGIMRIGEATSDGMTESEFFEIIKIQVPYYGGFKIFKSIFTDREPLFKGFALRKVRKMQSKTKINDRRLSFGEIARDFTENTLNRDRDLYQSEKLKNAYKHVLAQSLVTVLFGEDVAELSSKIHERHQLKEWNGLDEVDQIDTYVDLINNQWGQQFGQELKVELGITDDTVWTSELTAQYLNGMQQKLTESMGSEFGSEYSAEDQYVKDVTDWINENK